MILKVTCRLKWQLGIGLTLQVELRMELGVQALVSLTWDKSEHRGRGSGVVSKEG